MPPAARYLAKIALLALGGWLALPLAAVAGLIWGAARLIWAARTVAGKALGRFRRGPSAAVRAAAEERVIAAYHRPAPRQAASYFDLKKSRG
jgi:hypothetical protein